tara:strand:- start:84 stop:362 length:279 start_codon:yes stop_codon:yes gene_type:complete
LYKRLIALFLLLTTPFILSAGSIDLSTDSHPMSGGYIEEEFDDDELFILLVAGVVIVTGAIVFGPTILEDGGLLGPPKYWETKINLLFGIVI